MIENFKILFALLHRDFKALAINLKDQVINTGIYITGEFIIFYKLFGILGFPKDLLASFFLGAALFLNISKLFSRAIIDIEDLANRKVIRFYTIIPFSVNWLIAKYILSYMMFSVITTTQIYIFIKFLMGSDFNLLNISIVPFLLVNILGLLMFSLIFLIAAFCLSMQTYLDNIFPRFITPMISLGPVWYIWDNVNSISPKLGLFLLFNPITYYMEGVRASALGGTRYLPAYSCAIVLFLISSVLVFVFKYLFKRRLDLV